MDLTDRDCSQELCIDYKLVNSFTILMVYPMPLISDPLEDLDKALWYCSLDMTSGFWVVPMTDRAREISEFSWEPAIGEPKLVPGKIPGALCHRFINAS
ncbi:reverse transcriptase [Phytophthora megakarya]|uniref:Reverse transcriptase n=1 Tax=Phytophthora megakarya TaxID=4795 RepID=A0A225UF39_9STRA|nr:reverse transcriptase [Phytophthora megakarya]